VVGQEGQRPSVRRPQIQPVRGHSPNMRRFEIQRSISAAPSIPPKLDQSGPPSLQRVVLRASTGTSDPFGLPLGSARFRPSGVTDGLQLRPRKPERQRAAEKRFGLVVGSRLVGSDPRAWHRLWTDYGALGNNRLGRIAPSKFGAPRSHWCPKTLLNEQRPTSAQKRGGFHLP
jgi:hypothetical protein